MPRFLTFISKYTHLSSRDRFNYRYLRGIYLATKSRSVVPSWKYSLDAKNFFPSRDEFVERKNVLSQLLPGNSINYVSFTSHFVGSARSQTAQIIPFCSFYEPSGLPFFFSREWERWGTWSHQLQAWIAFPTVDTIFIGREAHVGNKYYYMVLMPYFARVQYWYCQDSIGNFGTGIPGYMEFYVYLKSRMKSRGKRAASFAPGFVIYEWVCFTGSVLVRLNELSRRKKVDENSGCY